MIKYEERFLDLAKDERPRQESCAVALEPLISLMIAKLDVRKSGNISNPGI